LASLRLAVTSVGLWPRRSAVVTREGRRERERWLNATAALGEEVLLMIPSERRAAQWFCNFVETGRIPSSRSAFGFDNRANCARERKTLGGEVP
jgi:hypothetical protein